MTDRKSDFVSNRVAFHYRGQPMNSSLSLSLSLSVLPLSISSLTKSSPFSDVAAALTRRSAPLQTSQIEVSARSAPRLDRSTPIRSISGPVSSPWKIISKSSPKNITCTRCKQRSCFNPIIARRYFLYTRVYIFLRDKYEYLYTGCSGNYVYTYFNLMISLLP